MGDSILAVIAFLDNLRSNPKSSLWPTGEWEIIPVVMFWEGAQSYLKVINCIVLRILTANNFLRDYSAGALKTKSVFLYAEPTQ